MLQLCCFFYMRGGLLGVMIGRGVVVGYAKDRLDIAVELNVSGCSIFRKITLFI